MAIDTNTVKKIAFLSRLRVSEDKIADTEKEFNNILKWIEQLKDVDTANVEPLESVNEEALRLREDVVDDGNQRDAVLANAPDAEYHQKSLHLDRADPCLRHYGSARDLRIRPQNVRRRHQFRYGDLRHARSCRNDPRLV